MRSLSSSTPPSFFEKSFEVIAAPLTEEISTYLMMEIERSA